MADINLALTTAGQILKAKIEMGKGDVPLEITRIVTASGTSADPLNLVAVVDLKQAFTITNRVTTGPRTSITCMLSNYGDPDNGIPPLAAGYPLTQIGFYAIDPDEGEILYRISQFDAPNYVPAAKERGWTFEPTFNFVTGNASEVVVQIDPSGFATRSDIWNSVELSGNAKPNPGVKTHYWAADDEPDYQPSDPADGYAGAKIVEVRVYADPGDPSASPYTVALPITVLEAVYNKATGKNLGEILTNMTENTFTVADDTAADPDVPASLRGGIVTNSAVFGYFDNAAGTPAPMYAEKYDISISASGVVTIALNKSFAPNKPPRDAATLVLFEEYAAIDGDTIKLLQGGN